MFHFPLMANYFPIEKQGNRKYVAWYSSLRLDEESNFFLSLQVFIAQLSCFSRDIMRLDVKLLNSIAV